MITLSTPTADPAGYLEMMTATIASELGGVARRRVTRVATIDGGSAFTDGGFSHSDSTVRVEWRDESAAQSASIGRLFELYPRLQLAIRTGVYLVAPQTYTPGSTSSLELLVVSKLSV